MPDGIMVVTDRAAVTSSSNLRRRGDQEMSRHFL
jgi:hypothetical protein